jgi:hypothetical protein
MRYCVRMTAYRNVDIIGDQSIMPFIQDSLLSWKFPRMTEDNHGALSKSSCSLVRVSKQDPQAYSSVFIESLAVTDGQTCRVRKKVDEITLKHFVGRAAAVLF